MKEHEGKKGIARSKAGWQGSEGGSTGSRGEKTWNKE